MENNPQFRLNVNNLENYTEKKTLRQNIEEHSLSLRKKKNYKQRMYELPPELLSDNSYKINISEIVPPPTGTAVISNVASNDTPIICHRLAPVPNK